VFSTVRNKEEIMASNKSFLAGLMLCCLTQVAYADDLGLSKKFSKCMDKSDGVTVEMLGCIAAETKLQDARLNKVYKDVIVELSEPRKKELRDAQRAWIKYRDANCKFYNDPDGGTMASVRSSDCFMMTTASRVKELENFKEW